MGEAAIQKLHEHGRMTARERLDYLLDEGSFVETDAFAIHRTTAFGMERKKPVTDGIVTGWGRIDGREVCVFSQDGTVFGGALGEVYGEKMVKIMELAVTTGRPLIGLYEGAGARIQEGAVSLDWIAKTFFHNVKASGVVPQISVIMGACAGGNAYSPAEIHMVDAGNTHYTAEDEQDALDWVCDLVGFLPSHNRQKAPLAPVESNIKADDITLDEIVPDSDTQPYDVHEVISRLTDDADFLEVQSERAQNIIVAFGLVEGQTVGFVASNPQVYAGCLDIDSSEKAARFVRTCDAFNIPLVFLVDVPGFLPGVDQEHNGILRRGAKLLYAYGEATVPKITVTMRKAYGGAYCVMGSKGLGADVNLAWPTAQIAVMGASAAIEFIHRKELRAARESGMGEADYRALAESFEREYEDQLLNPFAAAERGLIDAVIFPSETRGMIARALRMHADKNVPRPARKHGNIPL